MRPPQPIHALAEAFERYWPTLRQATEAAAQNARKNLTRYAQYGPGGIIATIAERKAEESQERAEAQEIRAEDFRSLLFGLLRFEDRLATPGVLDNLKVEMAGYRKIAEAEMFDYFEGQMFEGERTDDNGIDMNR
jgi:hypothetical protein